MPGLRRKDFTANEDWRKGKCHPTRLDAQNQKYATDYLGKKSCVGKPTWQSDQIEEVGCAGQCQR
jgi:hypothetical protein